MSVTLSDELVSKILVALEDLVDKINDPNTFVGPIPDYAIEFTMTVESLINEIKKEIGDGQEN